MEEEKEQGRGVWRLDCGAMVGWFARSQVAGGPKDADCCCCLLKSSVGLSFHFVVVSPL